MMNNAINMRSFLYVDIQNLSSDMKRDGGDSLYRFFDGKSEILTRTHSQYTADFIVPLSNYWHPPVLLGKSIWPSQQTL